MRRLAVVLAFVSMFSLCGCMGLVPLGAAVDDMIVDIDPGDAPPEFNLPGFDFVFGKGSDLHTADYAWDMFYPWLWFNGWTFAEGE